VRVSPETIYQALFVHGRGALRADLHRHLRTGRAVRRPHGSTGTGAKTSKIPNMVLISDRPAEADDRAVGVEGWPLRSGRRRSSRSR
jgi:IS30 family transposase